MKTNKTFNQGGAYESPTLTALELKSEGLLCVSGVMDAKDWETGQVNWFE